MKKIFFTVTSLIIGVTSAFAATSKEPISETEENQTNPTQDQNPSESTIIEQLRDSKILVDKYGTSGTWTPGAEK